MLDALSSLFDPTGFPPRRYCGTGWTAGLVWLHITSDLFIWLAYVSIPLVLFHFTRRRELPFPRLFVLFALFILACGTTHLIDALAFDYPVYRFAGLMKAVTAVASWATVLALVPVIPRVMELLARADRSEPDTKQHRPLSAPRPLRLRGYIVGVLAAVQAVLVRAALDPVLQGDHIFVVALLAVVYVSWQHGFGPGIVCLVIGVGGYTTLFVPKGRSVFDIDTGMHLATALFFFCGVACAALGQSQRSAQRRARAALAASVARRDELESEVVRRRVVEAALRQRETELVSAQRETAEALARLNAFLDNAPMGIAFFDPDLRFVRVNPYLAAANGKRVEEHIGRALPDVLPDFPPDVIAAYRRTAAPNGAPFTAQLRRPDRQFPGETRVWQVTAFPIREADRHTLGAGVVAQDVTDRLKAEEEVRRSERNLSDFFDNANVGLHWVGPDDTVLRVNKAELEMLGYARDEIVGRPLADLHADPAVSGDMLTRLRRGERLDNYPARLRCKDGGTREVLVSSSALWEDGRFVHSRCFTRDVTEVARATDELAERARTATLRADVAAALASGDETRVALQACADTLVRQVGAARARVWTIDPSGRWLELQASAGAYTHTNGAHGRVAVGQFRIGRIAESQVPHLTNDAGSDPNVSDPEWAAREGMVAFAGLPLVVEGRTLGVLALFARHALSDALVAELGPVAASVAQYLARRRALDAVRESEERYRVLTEAVPHVVWNADAAGEATYFNRRWAEYTGLSLDRSRGRGWLDAVHPHDRAHVMETWWAVVNGAGANSADRFGHEFRLRDVRSGGYRWFLSVAVPLPLADGRVDCWIGSMADIHEQKTAAEAVRESEAFRRSAFENSPDCLKILGTDGRVLEMNEAGCRLMEVDDFESIRGTLWSDLWPAANRETVREALAVARSGRVGRFQGFNPTLKGAPKYWDVSVSGVPGPDGRPFRLIGVARDVTEERRAEQRVRESELMLRQLADSMPQIVFAARPDGHVDYYNRRWYEYTGFPDDGATGDESWAPVLEPDQLESVSARWRHSVRTGEPYQCEYRFRRADGAFRWHLGRALPVRDLQGDIVRWYGTNTDIHDAKLAAEALLRSELRFRTLTEAVPQIVWTADRTGEVTFFNRRWDEYTGTPLEVGRQRGWEGGPVHPEDADQLRARWQLCVAQGADGFSCEFRLQRAADHAYRWMLSVAIPLRDGAGAVTGWVGTLTDIDDQKRQTQILEQMVRSRTLELERANAALSDEVEERKAAEEQVRAVAAELGRSNEELEKFAYVASHDLQEPLRKIQAFGDRLKTKCRDLLPDNGKEYVDRMQVAAGRMRRLIDDLLMFSRVATQRRPLVRVDLGKLVREVASDLDVRIAQTEGTVVIGGLPEVDADVTQMRQLFQNLIANALKFHRPGVPPVVEIAGEPVRRPPPGADAGEPVPMCRVTVRDNGIGFDEKYRDRIFAVFQRLHGRDQYEGTGVGLAICRKIVERHGGTITAHSREGEGTTFVVDLPARQAITPEGTLDNARPE